MINQVVLVGRLTKDPELRYTPNGIATSTFTIAVNRAFTNQQGEREADFINCVVWRKSAENLANYQKKGNLIGITGRIQTRSYEGQDGKRVYVTEVVCEEISFLEPKSKNGGNGGGNFSGYQQNAGQGGGQFGGQSYPPQNGGQNGSQYGGQSYPPQNGGQGGGQSYPPQNPPFNNPDNIRLDENPFNTSSGPIEVSEDDLPF